MGPSLLCINLLGLLWTHPFLAQASDSDDSIQSVATTTTGRLIRCSYIRNALKNGKVKVRSRGRIAKFQCNNGFDMVGKRFATCLLGKWDNPVPYCVAKGCPPREAPPNGNILHLYGGAVLLYTCQPGYVLNGSANAHCDGRKWNDTAPSCQMATTDPVLECDFESPDICGWSHDPSHDFDWKRHQFGTPSGHVGTGPSFDHTLGKGQPGYYMFTEASAPRKENDIARLFSPVFTANESPGCFVFWYHMYGVTIGILRVYIKEEGQLFQEVSPVWTLAGDQGNQWHRGTVPLPSMHSNFQIVVEGLRGSNYVGDSAIDDVGLRHTDCDALEDTNGTDSCNTRCGSSDSSATCGCATDCEMNSTCCHDYWITCTATNKPEVTKNLSESDNDEDNNIPMNVTIDVSSTVEATNQTNTLEPKGSSTTESLRSTNNLETTEESLSTTATTDRVTDTTHSDEGMTTLQPTEPRVTTTERVTDAEESTTTLQPTELMVTTTEQVTDTTHSDEGMTTLQPTEPKVTTTEGVTDVEESTTTSQPTEPKMTTTEGVTDVEESTTTSQPTEQKVTKTDWVTDADEGMTTVEPTTEQTTTQDSITTEERNPEDDQGALTKPNQVMTTFRDDTLTEAQDENPEDSPPTIEPNTEMSKETIPAFTQTNTNTSRRENTTEDILDLFPNDTRPSEEFQSWSSPPMEEEEPESETTQVWGAEEEEEEEEESITPAGWGERTNRIRPRTGFSSKKQEGSHVLLSVGSAVGVLVIGLAAAGGIYVVMRRRRVKAQNDLADDSEMRYLPESEMVEMINNSHA